MPVVSDEDKTAVIWRGQIAKEVNRAAVEIRKWFDRKLTKSKKSGQGAPGGLIVRSGS